MLLINEARKLIRTMMHYVALQLHRLSKGKLHPNVVTITGVLMHIPIAFLIAQGEHPFIAAVLLIIFGLFDTLDGELARLQNRSSPQGMLLDASTDRMKEVMLYTAIAWLFTSGDYPHDAIWAVWACGASLCVSYVKAKGEAAVASLSDPIPHHILNRMFKDGLLTFELRIALLIIGLFTGQLLYVTIAIAILATYTALQRLVIISRHL